MTVWKITDSMERTLRKNITFKTGQKSLEYEYTGLWAHLGRNGWRIFGGRIGIILLIQLYEDGDNDNDDRIKEI